MIAESTHLADENLRLRRDVAGMRQAMAALCETNDALRRENGRLRAGLKLIVTETERHRLLVENHWQEFAK